MSNTNFSRDDFCAIYDAGLKQNQLLDIDGTPALIVRENSQVKLLEQMRERPRRIEQAVNLTTPRAFLDYFNEFSTDDSAVFINQEHGSVTGILDYHSDPETPQNCKHIVRYNLPKTPEWSKWNNDNGLLMTQEAFALFIEDMSPEIVAPTSAEMLEIALTLNAKTNIKFRSAKRLDNGQTQITYNETIDATAGANGQLEIPEKITIAMKVFKGDPETYAMDARLRYRIKEGALRFMYELIRPERIYDDAIDTLFKHIKEHAKTSRVYYGKINTN